MCFSVFVLSIKIFHMKARFESLVRIIYVKKSHILGHYKGFGVRVRQVKKIQSSISFPFLVIVFIAMQIAGLFQGGEGGKIGLAGIRTDEELE